MLEDERRAKRNMLPPPVSAEAVVNFREGDFVLREGEDSYSFFVLLSGQVRILRRNKVVRILHEQDVFGLENLVCKKPYPYTVQAMVKSRIASYGQAAFDYLLRNNRRMTEKLIGSVLTQLLQTSDRLSDGEPVDVRLSDGQVSCFGDGEVIMREGERRDSFFRLVSTEGGLKVTSKGREICRITELGQFFGEMDLLLEQPSRSTVSSIGESMVEVCTAEQLDAAIRTNPDWALQVIRRFAELAKQAG